MLCNPVIHQKMGLLCPCTTKSSGATYGNKGTIDKSSTPATTLSQIISERDKELLKPKIIEVPFSDEPVFQQDWKGYSRHIWNVSNFYGTAPLIVNGEKINGFTLSTAFVGRLSQIVSGNRGLVVSGDKQSKLIISFGGEAYTVQFSIMSLKDRMTILVDGVEPAPNTWLIGRKIQNRGAEFVGEPMTPDYEGTADLLFKFEKAKQVEIVFYNRIVLSDILYKK